MKLLLIRHGQSMNNHLEQEAGDPAGRHPDPALTDLGHEQAQRLATWAVSDPLCQRVTCLASSLTTRAVQTAAPLAQALRLDVHGFVDAYECGGLNTGPEGNFAPVAGGDHESLRLHCPDLLWPQELTGQRWEGGYEPWNHQDFAARASRLTTRLQHLSTEADVIALITHHDFAQFLIADLLGVPNLNAETLTFRLNNTATAYIELGTDSSGQEFRTLHWLNRSPHLP